jgi:hypothetical protein
MTLSPKTRRQLARIARRGIEYAVATAAAILSGYWIALGRW